ncbi:MAG: helix-turn-helix domain-containing protein [Sideroxydans sp.]|nr:helix-turn-helix domain-containing protein [Sideroxydans sp.]
MNIDFEFLSSLQTCQEIGVRLRTHRLAQNLQQAELALKAGVSKLTIINLEKKGTVTFHSFIQVVRALGLLDELTEVFKLQSKSIAMMEAADAATKRVRASSRRKRLA